MEETTLAFNNDRLAEFLTDVYDAGFTHIGKMTSENGRENLAYKFTIRGDTVTVMNTFCMESALIHSLNVPDGTYEFVDKMGNWVLARRDEESTILEKAVDSYIGGDSAPPQGRAFFLDAEVFAALIDGVAKHVDHIQILVPDDFDKNPIEIAGRTFEGNVVTHASIMIKQFITSKKDSVEFKRMPVKHHAF